MPLTVNSTKPTVPGLLHAVGTGDGPALQALFAALYDELKLLAHSQLGAGRGATINTTALVHETYLKLIQPSALRLNDRGHFFATAAKAMRQIVIDHARRRVAAKRGGADAQAVTLDERIAEQVLDSDQLVHLDDALNRLQQLEPRLAELHSNANFDDPRARDPLQ